MTSAFGMIIFVPLLLFFILGSPLSFDYPALKGFNFKGGMVIRPEFIAMFLALTIYTAAFISETVRSGILSVTKGQREASASLGLKKSWIMRLIIIPQALRVIVPPLTSQYLKFNKKLIIRDCCWICRSCSWIWRNKFKSNRTSH